MDIKTGNAHPEMVEAFKKMHEASRHEKAPDYRTRMERLDKLLAMVRGNQEEIIAAISEDFGNRSSHESTLAEIFTTVSGIKHSKSKLKKWMAPKSRPVSWVFKPGKARIQYQPVGVVGIIVPWNYPINLTMLPLEAALAAGNRVMIKPSEFTPKTSALIGKLLGETFEPDVVTVVEGGPEVAESFSHLPFDHLLFTGSTSVGHHVMRAASDNLTPVTLELGGKSPAIVNDAYPLDKALRSILVGKLMNAGQTCIAPDYLMVPRTRLEEVKVIAGKIVAKLYPTLANNPDYTSIVNERHYERITNLINEAREKGASIFEINPAEEQLSSESRKISPTLIFDGTDEMTVMGDEIFGPVLPVVPYDTLDEAIRYVNDRPRPLALYYFDKDKGRIEKVLDETVSGGVSINETLLHIAQEDLPFGGIGPSGMGHYHGQEGFETFSKKKGVFFQSSINGSALLHPPYGKRVEMMMKTMIGK
ncbi:MAG: coniferyl aldehyde dehydrogenase [Alphaproteobacteria bacterium]|nr:coniferyl aldehyde dehydrogenase [Alphaproteobacteria bacterium]